MQTFVTCNVSLFCNNINIITSLDLLQVKVTIDKNCVTTLYSDNVDLQREAMQMFRKVLAQGLVQITRLSIHTISQAYITNRIVQNSRSLIEKIG